MSADQTGQPSQHNSRNDTHTHTHDNTQLLRHTSGGNVSLTRCSYPRACRQRPSDVFSLCVCVCLCVLVRSAQRWLGSCVFFFSKSLMTENTDILYLRWEFKCSCLINVHWLQSLVRFDWNVSVSVDILSLLDAKILACQTNHHHRHASHSRNMGRCLMHSPASAFSDPTQLEEAVKEEKQTEKNLVNPFLFAIQCRSMGVFLFSFSWRANVPQPPLLLAGVPCAILNDGELVLPWCFQPRVSAGRPREPEAGPRNPPR